MTNETEHKKLLDELSKKKTLTVSHVQKQWNGNGLFCTTSVRYNTRGSKENGVLHNVTQGVIFAGTRIK